MVDAKGPGYTPESLYSEHRTRHRERLIALRSYQVPAETKKSDERTKLPRIVLKNSLGIKLDTFTVLQEAIYRAKWNVKNSKEAVTAEEWRLPNAPLPARPDYSRAAPSLSKSRTVLRPKRDWQTHRSLPGLHYLDTDVDDVGFVAESVNHLPKVPSLSFLHKELWAEPKKYFQIVERMLLHKKILSETDKRDAIYNFPGFCSGCQRSGLCYGCERSSQPHYHIDRVMKTGGGFTYFKKDRPENELYNQNPLNWRLQFPELALRALMEDDNRNSLHNQRDIYANERDGKGRRLPLIPQFSDAFAADDRRGSPSVLDDENDADYLEGRDILNDLDNDKYFNDNQRRRIGQGQEGTDENSKMADGQYEDINAETGHRHAGDHRSVQVDMEGVSPWDGSERGRRESELGNGDGHTHVTGSDGTSYLGTSKYSTSQESRRTRRTMETDYSHDSGHDSQRNYIRRRDDDDDEGEDEENYEDDDEDEDVSGSPTSSQRRRRLYKAPSPFKLKPKKHRVTQSRSPFSMDRKYNIPKGKPLQIKKGEKSPTQVMEFKRGESSWKEPKKFSVKKSDKEATRFWSPTHKEKEQVQKKRSRPRKANKPHSPDSGLESEKVTDSIQEVGAKPIEQERVPSPISQGSQSEIEKPKREKPKKTKKEPTKQSKPSTPAKSITPKSPEPPEPEPEVESKTPEPVNDHVPTPTIPELPPLDLPPLPDIMDEKKTTEKRLKLDNRMPIEPMPKIKDALPPPPPKKAKSPKIPKMKPQRRKSPKPAEAPVTTEEIKEMKDPLDFLAKYCIISKDRLPFYDRIFKKVVSGQPPKYERQPPLSPRTGMPLKGVEASWSSHELNMFRDLIVLNRGQDPVKPGINTAEQYLEKICYTLEMLDKKHFTLTENLQEWKNKRTQLLAEKAKERQPEIATLAFKPKAKKSKKKKKKKKNGEVEYVFQPQTAEDITDEVIVSRIDDKLLKSLLKEPELYQIECEMDRCSEKIVNVEDRLMQLEGEKNVFGMYCMEVFFNQQNENQKSISFRRQQSALFNKLHPDPDVEMNLEEVQSALQIINNQLLTEREFAYLFHILNLAGRRKINFKLFAVVAALSEKFIEMDPLIRNMWNRLDYNGLDFKMERSKKLFSLLENGETVPYGNALASSLAVELTAGGLTQEQIRYVLSKFNREGKGFVDFMDYVTYVPLFLEIHERIISEPLKVSISC